jgi:hypothetical protein
MHENNALFEKNFDPAHVREHEVDHNEKDEAGLVAHLAIRLIVAIDLPEDATNQHPNHDVYHHLPD